MQFTKNRRLDPVDLMDKTYLATLKERYRLDALKQSRDSKTLSKEEFRSHE